MRPGIEGGGRGPAEATDKNEEGKRLPIDGLFEVEGAISNWSQNGPFSNEFVISELLRSASKASPSPCCEVEVICGEQAIVAKVFLFSCSLGSISAKPGCKECSDFVSTGFAVVVDSQETRFSSSISCLSC